MNMEWGAVIFRGLNMTTNPYSKSVNKNSLGIFKVAFNCFHGRGIRMAVAQHSERGEEHTVANLTGQYSVQEGWGKGCSKKVNGRLQIAY